MIKPKPETLERKMTPLLVKFVALANGLDNPLGRAAYMVNRHYNTGTVELAWNTLSDVWARPKPEALTEQRNWDKDTIARHYMSRVQAETAIRWEKHWRNDGSLKCLGRSQKEEARRRKDCRRASQGRSRQ